jgi:transposase-like protein
VVRDGGVGAVEVKRQIAEESFEGNYSVAQLAQKYAVNANQIFKRRKDCREEGLKSSHSNNLRPAIVSRGVIVKRQTLVIPVRHQPELMKIGRSNFPEEIWG